MCAGLMVNARIDRCVYGAADPKSGAAGTLYHLNNDARLNHAFPVTAGVLAGSCAELLRSFFAERRVRGVRPVDEGTACGPAPEPGAPACAATHRAALRVLLAVDSFKGSATSVEAEAWLAEGAAQSGAGCPADQPAGGRRRRGHARGRARCVWGRGGRALGRGPLGRCSGSGLCARA